MIKSITIIRHAPSASRLQSLERFFDGLGFEPGLKWNDPRSRGSGFIAPVGQVEFVSGELPAAAEIMVEVSGLDTLHGIIAARSGGAKSGGKSRERPGAKRRPARPAPPSAISETWWGARLFYAEPVPGMKLAFWQWASPEKMPDNGAAHPRHIEGSLVSRGRKFGIVVSRWNSFITERLLQGAIDALRRSGAPAASLTIVRVPGAFEIPSAARALAGAGKVDAIVCLGCLIKGETPHYEHISAEVTRGIGQSAQATGVPHAFGVLTCENLAQAIDRAGLKSGNKGFEAAMAAVEMASLHRQLKARGGKVKKARAVKLAPGRKPPSRIRKQGGR